MCKRDELRQTLRKVVPLRPPPPNLYTEARIQKFQDSIRSIFLSQDHALTKNYLKFLVEKVIVNGPHVQLVTRSEDVVRMTVSGGSTAPGTAPERDPAVLPLSSRSGSPAALLGEIRDQFGLLTNARTDGLHGDVR
jgi:hypothetical protein